MVHRQALCMRIYGFTDHHADPPSLSTASRIPAMVGAVILVGGGVAVSAAVPPS